MWELKLFCYSFGLKGIVIEVLTELTFSLLALLATNFSQSAPVLVNKMSTFSCNFCVSNLHLQGPERSWIKIKAATQANFISFPTVVWRMSLESAAFTEPPPGPARPGVARPPGPARPGGAGPR